MSKRTAIRDLSCAAILSTPINADWDGETLGSSWDYWSADKCDTCGKTLVGQGESIQHCDVDGESKCEGWLSLSPPMMSYWYPVEGIEDVEEAARKLAHLPLCVVKVNDETGVALTGGGMDLSWEICAAFVSLGIPASAALLPFAGDGWARS